ncbi:Holliday junction resolvase RuvX [Sulfurospirillum sp. 1612]|uniref:Holliday junction resolvase RuvX n=1 Tax=Sulfurospirillum sp. 1612 TaxID=3094835 RepID=UPI002F95F7F6
MIYASIDVGLKRIGVAVCLDGKIVFPKDAIMRKNRQQAARDVDDFLQEWHVDVLVVGLPQSGSSAQEMQRRIRHFVSLLDFDQKIAFQDEYGSSLEAQEMMKGITKQRKDGKIDSLAAKIILERWLS